MHPMINRLLAAVAVACIGIYFAAPFVMAGDRQSTFLTSVDLDAAMASMASLSWANTEIANRPIVYQGATQKSSVKVIGKSGVVSSGAAALYLTDNGLAGGTALCANVYPEFYTFQVNDSSTPYQFAWSLSGDKKTLTVTVNKAGQSFLSLLGLNVLTAPAAANGATIYAQIWCD